MQKRTFLEFSEVYYNKFPNTDLTLLKFLKNRKIEVQNQFGIFIVNKNDLLSGKTPSILTCINKEEFLQKQYYLINKEHSIKIIKYIDSKNIIVSDKYGEYNMCLTSVLKGYKPAIESSTNKTQNFINRANELHNNLFDYSLVEYKNSLTKIKIICKKHGIFEHSPQTHLQKRGCRKCQYDKVSTWSYANWEKAGLKSKKFDSFKIYIIKCWNENETFYKIGKTFLKVKERFHGKKFPYNYEIIEIYKGDSKKISQLEKELQMLNLKNKYKPQMYFNGRHECFKEIDI